MKCSQLLAAPATAAYFPLTSFSTMHKLINMQSKCFKVQSQSLMNSNDVTFLPPGDKQDDLLNLENGVNYSKPK